MVLMGKRAIEFAKKKEATNKVKRKNMSNKEHKIHALIIMYDFANQREPLSILRFFFHFIRDADMSILLPNLGQCLQDQAE